MAKHNNKNRYPVKEPIGENDYIVGEDGLTKKTVNFKGSAFASSIDQDNILRPIFTKTALGKTINQAVTAINETAFFVKGEKEQLYFRVPRNLVTIVNGGGASEGVLLTNQQLHYDYYLLQNKGKGTYGVGGQIVVTASDILLFKTTEVYNIVGTGNLPPVVYQLQTTDIETPPENILNNAPRSGGFDITNDADFFFEVREIDQSVVETSGTPPVFTGQFALYRWVGDEGNYGLSGTDDAVSHDFEVVELKDINVTIDDFLSLLDVADSSYSGKLGHVPMVSYDPFSITSESALPSTPAPPMKLKLTKIPQFTDIYRANALITGGIIPRGGLTYTIWATEFIINGVKYDIPVSEDVTLSNGGAEPRFDVFAIRMDVSESETSASVVVIEGQESATPVIPTVDLTKELSITPKLVLAGETTDPDLEIELVFNENTGENTEWDNLYLVTGGNLADATAPFIGSTSLKIPQSSLAETATPNKVSWINDVKYSFEPNGNLVFALKTNAIWGRTSSLEITLIDSDNPSKTWKIQLTSLSIGNYGFNPWQFEWKLVSIPMRDFIPISGNQTEFDTIEFKLNKLPETSVDWINFQKGAVQPINDKPVLKIKSEDNSLQIDEYEPQKFNLSVNSALASTLVAVNEGNGVGYRLNTRNPNNYGNIGLDAIDFSLSNSASSTRGSTGARSVTFGLNNTTSGIESATFGRNSINPYIRTLVIGNGIIGESTNGYSDANVIISDGSLVTYNNLYANFICGFESSVGTQGATLNDAVIYGSVISGQHLNVYGAKQSLVVGNALVGGAARCAIVGSANVDLTQTTATQLTSTGQAYNPRFIVGVGNWNEDSNTGTRANGFVVMSDGTASFPSLTDAKINASGNDSAVTKGWVIATAIKSAFATVGTGLPNTDPAVSAYRTAKIGLNEPNPQELLDIVGTQSGTTGSFKIDYAWTAGETTRVQLGGQNLLSEIGVPAGVVKGSIIDYFGVGTYASRRAYFANGNFGAINPTLGAFSASAGVSNLAGTDFANMNVFPTSANGGDSFAVNIRVQNASTDTGVFAVRQYGLGSPYTLEPVAEAIATNSEGDVSSLRISPHFSAFSNMLKASNYGLGTFKKGYTHTDTLAKTGTAPTTIGDVKYALSVDSSGNVMEIPALDFKTLIFKVTQSGTGNPTVVVIANNTGLNPVFTRSSAGRYTWNSGATNFTNNVTAITSGQTNPNYMQAVYHDGVSISIDTKDFTGAFVDGALQSFTVEVKIFNPTSI